MLSKRDRRRLLERVLKYDALLVLMQRWAIHDTCVTLAHDYGHLQVVEVLSVRSAARDIQDDKRQVTCPISIKTRPYELSKLLNQGY